MELVDIISKLTSCFQSMLARSTSAISIFARDNAYIIACKWDRGFYCFIFSFQTQFNYCFTWRYSD